MQDNSDAVAHGARVVRFYATPLIGARDKVPDARWIATNMLVMERPGPHLLPSQWVRGHRL
jgi:hypothetical protein